jgi:prepilin-type N-terminal cleavage/methylation domain-containing protein
MKRDAGFTLVELLVVMVIMAFALAVTSNMFLGLLNQYNQQGKIAETNIEGMVGLELLREDIERAGYGLPWQTPIVYSEAGDIYDDAPSNPPRPILSDSNYAAGFPITTTNGYKNADLLVIKAANIIRNASAQKWTYVTDTGTGATWTGGQAVGEYPLDTDYVIMLSQGTSDVDTRTLVTNGDPLLPSPWVTTFKNLTAFTAGASPDPLFVYGLYDKSTAPRMPFNRADYYILGPQNFANTPARCAPNTGVLVKSTISQSTGGRTDVLPLLDCVADMKVIFMLDPGNGVLKPSDNLIIPYMSAQQIRQQVKEVRVYILAQEGQYDKTYTHPVTVIPVGEAPYTHQFDIGANVNYRWKLYTIVVQPKNMKQRLSS